MTKTEIPDPLVVDDLISYKFNNSQKLARLISQYINIFSNISEGMPSFFKVFTENDSGF